MIFEIEVKSGIMPQFGTFETEIRHVVDGDSLMIPNRQYIRLVGVNTPELKGVYCSKEQPYAKEAADLATYMWKNKIATVETFGLDKYGRTLAKMTINGIDISSHLLSIGCGFYITPPLKEDRVKYRKLRDYAKYKKLGIWGLSEPSINPKKWREMYGLKKA